MSYEFKRILTCPSCHVQVEHAETIKFSDPNCKSAIKHQDIIIATAENKLRDHNKSH